jgi:hypothetical protein
VSSRSTNLLLLVTFLLVLGSYWQLYELNRAFRDLGWRIEHLAPPLRENIMYHAHVSGGVRREFTTSRNSSESVADWVARHNAAVVAFVELYPPD